MQEVGIDAVRLVEPSGVGFAVEGFNALRLHQRPVMLTPDFNAFELEHIAQNASAGKRAFAMPAMLNINKW